MKIKLQATLNVGSHAVIPFDVTVPIPDEKITEKPIKDVEIDLSANGSGVDIAVSAFGFLKVHKTVLDTNPHVFHVAIGSISLQATAQIVAV